MILVAYYSRSGKTKLAAEDIARRLNADTERIMDKTDRSGLMGFLHAGRDAMRDIPTQIEKSEKDPSVYDTVVIGMPVWAGNITPPIKAYLVRHKDSFKQIAFFTTAFFEKPEKFIDKLENIIGKKFVCFTGFAGKEFKPKLKDAYEHKLSVFVSKIQ